MGHRSERRRNPLGAFGAGPVGSRHEMCVRCYKPETKRAMLVHGDIDFLAASLNHWAGLPLDEAMATAEHIYKDPENKDIKPGERNTTVIRLCRGCAKLTGVPVHSIESINAGGELAAVIQPEDI